jgi:hypothetical protein
MNTELLRSIANANAANSVIYVSQADGMELFNAGYITVDQNKTDPNDPSKVAATITNNGGAYLHSLNGGAVNHTKPVHAYSVETGGLELPKVKRGFTKGHSGGGAAAKYPFDTMEVGSYFFVPNTDVKKGNALKTIGSAVGSANQRFAEGTGEHETVKRAKRGPDHKAIKDANGKNVMEEVTIEKKKFTRKFVVRAVEAGKQYGSFIAPSDGAVVQRTA